MKALIVFDSNFGNTRKIAEVIAGELGNDAAVVAVSDFDQQQLIGVDLLIVGSPIIAWKPTEKILEFLEDLNKEQLKGVKITAFDTRVKLFIHGDAKEKIATKLESLGARIIIGPQAFYVKGKEGPLLDGELYRVASWIKSLKLKLN
ncbi:MAG TPA: flavodoxin domain-containing protein [Candidatus Paceibacterota bacterium]|jgi:flavodoxin|nr:flavodoxin domain-containing protein [Candidatus Paceibacterota bacterium]HPT40233.1 flavodoxin domain-containing protein [Candidatus Paceibacterota bacterium]